MCAKLDHFSAYKFTWEAEAGVRACWGKSFKYYMCPPGNAKTLQTARENLVSPSVCPHNVRRALRVGGRVLCMGQFTGAWSGLMGRGEAVVSAG